jgi:short-subunit dehydrogenase
VTQKKALVTGASEGIGRIFAQQLAKSGYQVTAVARNEARLQELTRELGAGHRYLVADLADAAAVDMVAADLTRERYDLLINNAGYGLYSPFQQANLAQLSAMIRVNIDAVLALAHAFLQTAKSGDALINVASTLAFGGFPSAAVYAATKAFLLSWSESVWYEQRDRGVYVMALCPGATETKFHQAAGGQDSNKPPAAVMMSAESVVEVGMAALAARSQPTVITGGKNRAMIFASKRLMTRRQAINMMGSFSRTP